MTVRMQDKPSLAEGLIAEGRHAEAIVHLKELAVAEPQETRHLVRIADAYRRLGSNTAAIVWYHRAARHYAEQGLLPKAVTIAKLILSIDPAHRQTQDWLATLYAGPEAEAAAPMDDEPSAGTPAISVELLNDFGSQDTQDDVFFQGGINFDDDEPPEANADDARSDVDAVDSDDILILEETTGDGHTSASNPEVEASAPELLEDPDIEDIVVAEVKGASLEELIQRLPRVPLFSDLTTHEFKRLIDHVSVQLYDEGESVVREGEKGDAFFIITSGTATVTKRDFAGRDVELATLHEGTFFGEFAYLANSRRRASVTAKTALEVLVIHRESMDSLTREHPRIRRVLKRFYSDRIVKNLLTISPLFESLKEEEKRTLLNRFQYVSVPPDATILAQGTQGDGLYVIVRGAVEVLRTAENGTTQKLAQLHEGEFFGEMSILAGAPVNATVRSIEKSGLLKLPTAEFESVAAAYPGLANVIRSFAEDRRRRNQAPGLAD